MDTFMLLMRGSQSAFVALPADEKDKIIAQHVAWSKELSELGLLVGGNGMSNITLKLIPDNGQIIAVSQPYQGTEEELSGFYLIKAENMDAAIELAKKCPALTQNESVEVIPLGH